MNYSKTIDEMTEDEVNQALSEYYFNFSEEDQAILTTLGIRPKKAYSGVIAK